MTNFKVGDGVVVQKYMGREFARVKDIKFANEIRFDREIDGNDKWPLKYVSPAPPIKVGDWVKVVDGSRFARINEPLQVYSIAPDGRYILEGLRAFPFTAGEIEPIYDYEPEKNTQSLNEKFSRMEQKVTETCRDHLDADDNPTPPFIRTIPASRELVIGKYDNGVEIVKLGDRGDVLFGWNYGWKTADECRELAHLLNQIAEVLEENAK